MLTMMFLFVCSAILACQWALVASCGLGDALIKAVDYPACCFASVDPPVASRHQPILEEMWQNALLLCWRPVDESVSELFTTKDRTNEPQSAPSCDFCLQRLKHSSIFLCCFNGGDTPGGDSSVPSSGPTMALARCHTPMTKPTHVPKPIG